MELKFDDFLFGAPTTTKTKMSNLVRTIEDIKRNYFFEINLDKYDINSPIDTKAVFIKGDKDTSVLRAKILKNGLPVSLVGCTITSNIKEGWSDSVTIPVTITDASLGEIEINLVSTVVDEQGENTFEIVIQKLSEVTVSQMYKYTVLDSIGEGLAGTNEQLTTLQSLINQIQEKITVVDNITEELEITQSDIDDILGMVGGL